MKNQKRRNKYYLLKNNIKNINQQTSPSLQKNAFFLIKKAFFFVLCKKQTSFSKEFFLNKKAFNKKYKLKKTFSSQINNIVSTMQDNAKYIKKQVKWYFFSKKIVFFYFKHFKKIRGLKKRQPTKGKRKREKYRHRVELIIRRKLFVRELFHERRAQKRLRRKSKFYKDNLKKKIGILHYVFTTRNVKYTFTTLKHRVLMYFSTGTKKIKKGRRKSLKAKKNLARRMARYIKWKKVKRLIVILHACPLKSINFLVRLYGVRRIRFIATILHPKRPHNGCRKKK